ncbi:MBL fold metallo-hydrolase [Actinomycetota bacterium Odt1-20B]
MRTLSLGPARIDRITELDRWPFAPRDLFPDITDEHLTAAAALGPRLVDPDTGELILGIHTYLIRTPTLTMLADSGNGNDKHRPALLAHHQFHTDYLNNLTAAGVTESNVDIVVSTHLHPDHCGWNTRLAKDRWHPTFPNATYLFAREEFDAHKANHTSQPTDPILADLARTFEDSVQPVLTSGQARIVDLPHTVLAEDDLAIRLLPSPGHTPGHLIVELTSGQHRAVITGDVIHHPFQFDDLDLPQGGDQAPPQAAATRRWLCETYADTNTLILTAHFPNPGHITATPTGYRFDYVSS